MGSDENAPKAEAERYGRYEVIRKLASGGMGEVYLAKSVGAAGFQKHVVIKKILPHLTEHPQTVKGLVREAKLLVILNHPNIVQVYDLGVEGTDYFMAMEYVHGYNLSTILHYCSKKRTIIPATSCAFIGLEVLAALAYAHELTGPDGARQNIIHRDVSPQNVLISQSGQVKLTDFGIAKVLSEAEDEHTQSLKGKWRYMAPEALHGGRIDHRYDLFAVGILLFESLCRRNLFAGKRDVDILNQVREAQIPPIEKYHPEVTGQLVEVVERALAKDPDKRFQTARELQQALLAAIHPATETEAADELRGFVTKIYEAEDFPLNKPKIVDPAALDVATTRSIQLQSSLSESPIAVGRRRARPGGVAIALLSVGLAAISAVVAYMAYTILYRSQARSNDKPVIIVAPRTPDAAPRPDAAAVALLSPDASSTKPNHRPPVPRGVEFTSKVGSASFKRHLPKVWACLAKHPRPEKGELAFKVVSSIRQNGTVANVKLDPAELTESPFGSCVVKVASRIRYPRHTTAIVDFAQPIRLK